MGSEQYKCTIPKDSLDFEKKIREARDNFIASTLHYPKYLILNEKDKKTLNKMMKDFEQDGICGMYFELDSTSNLPSRYLGMIIQYSNKDIIECKV